VSGRPQPVGGWPVPEYCRVRLVRAEDEAIVVTEHKMDFWNDAPAVNFDLFGVRWVSKSVRVVYAGSERIFVVSAVPGPR
jgi:hypothetical protein